MKRFTAFLVAVVLTVAAAFAGVDIHGHRYDAMNIMPVRQGDIVFVGNSITNMHEWWKSEAKRS